jgi:lipopolysaccharide/colanic/teichoic acid biosynthesis glycosyltransferase
MQETDFRLQRAWRAAGFGRSLTRAAQWRLYRASLMLLDAVIVAAASGAAYGIRMNGWLFGWTYDNPIDVFGYMLLVVCSVPIWWMWSALFGLYTPDQLLGGMAEYQNVIKSSSASVLTIIFTTFLLRESVVDLSRWWLALAWSLSIVGLTAARFAARRVVYRLWAAGVLVSRVLIVGANDQGVAIARQWRGSPRAGMHVIGFIDDFKAPGTVVCDDLSVVGRPSALATLVHEYGADEVVVVSSAVAWETFGELVTAHHAERGYVMRLAPGLYDLLTSGMAVTNKTFVPLLTLQETRVVGLEAAAKTIFDMTATAAAAALTAPLALLVVFVLRRRDPHAPLFVRTPVLGMRGRVFDQWWFREGPDWMRRSGLDRWPQLWNVLRREMSIVGPRARAQDQRQDASLITQLTAVRPGIVGPWVLQDATTSSDARRDEVTYVRNWEIWRDVPIVLHAVHRHFQRVAARLRARLNCITTRATVGSREQREKREES